MWIAAHLQKYLTEPLTGSTAATVFLGADGLLMTDYLRQHADSIKTTFNAAKNKHMPV